MNDLTALSDISHGLKDDSEMLKSITVGLDAISSFYKKNYFASYIKAGGSKMKFISGKKGAGKSHLLALLSTEAKDSGLATVTLSASEVKLNDFTYLYLTVLGKIDLDNIVDKMVVHLISELGFDPNLLKEGRNFLQYLDSIGEGDPIMRQELRGKLRSVFTKNPFIDSNFGTVFSLFCGERLGLFSLEPESKILLDKWLRAEKEIKLTSLRSLGLAPYRINKLNARSMLRSLAEILRYAGFTGLFISVDDLETLLCKSTLQELHYTKLQRDDAYESLRQLIDDIDNYRYIMFAFAFDRSLLDDEKAGMKTYQALWLRMQNEILSKRLNLFADLIDLDSANQQLYTPQSVVQMSEKLVSYASSNGIELKPLATETALALMEKARFGTIALPLLVSLEVLKSSEDKEEENV